MPPLAHMGDMGQSSPSNPLLLTLPGLPSCVSCVLFTFLSWNKVWVANLQRPPPPLHMQPNPEVHWAGTGTL